MYINMDETSVAYNYGRGKGFVVSKRALPTGKKHRKESCSSRDKKANVTYLSFVTHDTAVQPKLPQFFIGNAHLFTLKLVGDVAPQLPAGYYM